MPEVLTKDQRRTLPAREALARKFSNPEEKSAHYRAMATRANAGRIVLSGEEAAALADAYGLLGRIAERVRASVQPAAGQEVASRTHEALHDVLTGVAAKGER
jgi:type VI protein secretion system component VasF